MTNTFGKWFKPIGPDTSSGSRSRSGPTALPRSEYSSGEPAGAFPLNSFLIALAVCFFAGLAVAGIGFGIAGPDDDLVGADLSRTLVVALSAGIGCSVAGLIAGAVSTEIVGPFAAVPAASVLLIMAWMIAGVSDSLGVLIAATFIPMGAGVAVGFVAGTGIRMLAEKLDLG